MRFVIEDAPARGARRPAAGEPRARVIRGHASYEVAGVIRVESFPWRPMRAARQICRRVVADPAGYMDVIRRVRLPGCVPLAAEPTTAPTFPRLARPNEGTVAHVA